jgi:hypothetical protein
METTPAESGIDGEIRLRSRGLWRERRQCRRTKKVERRGVEPPTFALRMRGGTRDQKLTS